MLALTNMQRDSVLHAIATSTSPDTISTPYIFTDQQSATDDDALVSRTYKIYADERKCLLISIILDCELEENKKRLQAAGRGGEHNSKLTDVGILMDIIEEGPEIYSFGGESELRLDVTLLDPDQAATKILSHIETCCMRSGTKLAELCRAGCNDQCGNQ
jgi:hypothetical protein